MYQELPTTMDHELLNVLRRGDEHQIRLLVVRMQKILSTISPRGNIVLHMAIRFQKHKVIREILWRQHSLLRKNNWKGETALLIAARAGDPAIVSTLLNYVRAIKNGTEAEPDSLLRMTDDEGNTSLHNGVRGYFIKLYKSLHARGPVLHPLCWWRPEMGCIFSKGQDADHPAARQLHDAILGRTYEDVELHYTIGKELGRGEFGITYLCTENSTGLQFACKSISKRKLVKDYEKDDVRGEVELFDRIVARGHYSERAAASVLRVIMGVVNVCHCRGVMHRDLKPENFLFTSWDENALLKATDFGLSVFFEEEMDQRVDAAILKGEINFQRDPFPSASSSAIELVHRMLTQDPKRRIIAAQVVVIKHQILMMKQNTAMNKLKKLALKWHSYDELREGSAKLGSTLTGFNAKQYMQAADIDGNGTIDYIELVGPKPARNRF
ncbi:calcium-dependent protein kinase 33 [Citrus sinensis]|nr:calcium-dependent protein kinase 33 [Citrus sinensis]